MGLLTGLLATVALGSAGILASVHPAEAARAGRTQGGIAGQAAVSVPQPKAGKTRAAEPSRTRTEMDGAAPGPVVLAALHRAEAMTGADAGLLLAIARRESRFDPAAQSRSSSARGLMQFTKATWLEVVRDFGHRHGLVQQAAVLSSVPRGSVPANGRVVAEVLRLRDDPRLAAVMTAERLESGRGALERAIGRRATPTDLYLVHLLGPAGAREFLGELARSPGRAAADVVGAAAKTNRALFARHGRQLSLAEVYRDVATSLATGAPDTAEARGAPAMRLADAR